MSRLSISHFLFGFWLIAFSALLGAFISTEETRSFILDPKIRDSWQSVLLKSSHGHSSLFGLIHIVFGLTLPYSRLSHRIKVFQTIGLLCGSGCMNILLVVKAFHMPILGFDLLGIFMGFGLSFWILSVIFHCFGLSKSLLK